MCGGNQNEAQKCTLRTASLSERMLALSSGCSDVAKRPNSSAGASLMSFNNSCKYREQLGDELK
jgi:hypothetical protein